MVTANASRLGWGRCATIVLLALLAAAVAAAEPAAGEPAAPAGALPQLPDKVVDQLRIEELQRQIEIIRLQQELQDLRTAANSDLGAKTRSLGDMRTLLEVNAEVRDLVQDAPELAADYRRILAIDALPAACRCLDAAQVNWLGDGPQAGRATVRLDGQHHDVRIGGTVGSSRCTLQAANASQATLACGGNRRTLGLYNPIGG